jgi:tetratricopeptide (TPR) repeat protein
MTTTLEEDFRGTPLFREAMHNFQLGNWENGLNHLKELEEKFPLEREIRALRQEMQLRAKIDQDELEDHKEHKKRRIIIWSIRLASAWLAISLAIWGFFTYSSWIQKQVAETRQKLDHEVQNLDLTVKFNNARSMLQAGRPAEAKSLFQEIAAANPEFPELQRFIDQADSDIQLQVEYEEAVKLIKEGDRPAAQEKFKGIAAQNPNYKDVALQLETIQQMDLLNDILTQADKAFDEKRWEEAITEYESLRAIEPEFQVEYVEERLYTSYIQAAEAALVNPVETLKALEHAEELFGKALKLRPRDTEILARRAEARKNVEERLVNSYLTAAQSSLVGQADSIKALQKAEAYLNKALKLRPGDTKISSQYEMAVRYLAAIGSFSKGAWDDAIDHLEFITAEEPGYADGTARQTLYEAYVARGNNRLVSGDFELALLDFQKGAVLAQQSPDSILRLFEAQLLVADTQGLLGNYKDSVRLYQAAIDLSGLGQLVQQIKGDLTVALDKASKLATRGDYKTAYQTYSSALHDISGLYQVNNVVVESGDYLTMLARRYNTTVTAILTANGISRASEIRANMTLKIPTLP